MLHLSTSNSHHPGGLAIDSKCLQRFHSPRNRPKDGAETVEQNPRWLKSTDTNFKAARVSDTWGVEQNPQWSKSTDSAAKVDTMASDTIAMASDTIAMASNTWKVEAKALVSLVPNQAVANGLESTATPKRSNGVAKGLESTATLKRSNQKVIAAPGSNQKVVASGLIRAIARLPSLPLLIESTMDRPPSLSLKRPMKGNGSGLMRSRPCSWVIHRV